MIDVRASCQSNTAAPQLSLKRFHYERFNMYTDVSVDTERRRTSARHMHSSVIY